jgi:hypothetical protein
MRPLPQPLQLLKLATTSYIRLRGSRGRGYSWQRVCTFGMQVNVANASEPFASQEETCLCRNLSSF